MKFTSLKITSDLTIVGAGMSGICAAIEGARAGLKVTLINNRGYLGGNASPEIRIDICGADGANEFNFYARETGILEELRLENLYRNPQGNVYLWHNVLLDWVLKEPNIQLFLNTNVDEVITDDTQKITMVAGSQLGTEKHFEFISPLYVDDTGDGTVGYLAGAETMLGRESRAAFNESIAPEIADDITLLSTLSFYSKDTKRKTPYTLPDFVDNKAVIDALAAREIPDRVPGHSRYEGYRMQWFYETGFGRHPINDAEAIIHDHRELIYSVWDHIKNSGHYDSETYDLEYVSGVPGKRESRRLLGDHILTENDIVYQVDFDDVIAHGGWSIDLHALEGFFSKGMTTHHYNLHGIYGIPLRSCYAKDVPNLFVASRCMSTTHVAFGSTRVMGTLSTIGQAVGSAASLCLKYNTTPRGIVTDHIKELQQCLLKNDQHILGHKNEDLADHLLGAKIQVSSTQALTLDQKDGHERLKQSLALILPVVDTLDSIDLLVHSEKETEFNYTIYTSKKNQNYKPERQLKSYSLKLAASPDDYWVTLPINCSTETGKLFIEFQKNDLIGLATTDDHLNGLISLFTQSHANESTYVDIESHEVKTSQWVKLKSNICFRCDDPQHLYQASNLNNGYNRNYDLPNLWLSKPGNATETILIDFDAVKTLNQLRLTFDSNLNFYYDNLEVYYDHNVMPALVKDYKVYAKEGDGYTLIKEVKGNHQRVNHLLFDAVQTKQLKIVLEASNGASRFGLYEIRAY